MEIPTRQKILMAAAAAFAERGYDGATIDQIAEAAGLKGPSLYRHFKSKDDILEALVARGEEYYEKNFGSEIHPGQIPESGEELAAAAVSRIHFTMHDPTVQKFRRIFTTEQFRSPAVAELATKHNLYGLVNMYSIIFTEMMDRGIMKKEDPALCALEFIAPVTLLIQTYDRQPEREAQLMATIEQHLRRFTENYLLK